MNGLRNQLNFSASLFCVVALLLSFGLHAVQVTHTHFSVAETHQHNSEHAGHSDASVPDSSLVFLGEVMHLSDKKYLLLVAGATIYLFVSFPAVLRGLLQIHHGAFFECLRQRRFWFNKLYNYLLHFYAAGILNPKLF